MERERDRVLSWSRGRDTRSHIAGPVIAIEVADVDRVTVITLDVGIGEVPLPLACPIDFMRRRATRRRDYEEQRAITAR